MDQEIKGLNHRKVGRYIVCIILCFISIFPFYVLIVNSTLKSSDSGAKTSGVNVLQAMLNSLIITVPATILQIYFGSLTAYAVTAYNFKGKKFIWAFIYAIMMIPTQVSIVGFVNICQLTGLYGTFWPMIIPAIAAPTTVYFMKQYMETGLSLEIVEAARIDGSSEFATFNRIVLPLLKPAMATQAIFGFVGSWNNLYTPSIILATERSKQTMPMYVSSLKANDKDLLRTVYNSYPAPCYVLLPFEVHYRRCSAWWCKGIIRVNIRQNLPCVAGRVLV